MKVSEPKSCLNYPFNSTSTNFCSCGRFRLNFSFGVVWAWPHHKRCNACITLSHSVTIGYLLFRIATIQLGIVVIHFSKFARPPWPAGPSSLARPAGLARFGQAGLARPARTLTINEQQNTKNVSNISFTKCTYIFVSQKYKCWVCCLNNYFLW